MIVLILPDINAEDELLERVRGGSPQAVMEIYDLYFQPVYQFIRLRTDDAAAAEDLAANVFLKLVSAFKTQKAPTHSLRGWLFKVARGELYHQYGRNKRYPVSTLEDWEPIPSGDADLEDATIRKLNVERTRQALRMLSMEQQEVLILRFGQALSLEETADVMGKSIAAIKSLQVRAVHSLRRIMGITGEEVS